jgi:CRISPR-associated protein Csx3
MTFQIEIQDQLHQSGAKIAKIGFGTAADNNTIVVDADQLANDCAKSLMGHGVLVDGRASLPVAFALSHAWAHIARFIGVFDPKLNGYVICVSHDAAHAVGSVIPA